jgi:hypothetical protein
MQFGCALCIPITSANCGTAALLTRLQPHNGPPVRIVRKASGGAGRAASRSAVARNSSCSGDLAQAGSVRAASPANARAWQRQPPQSDSRSSQERQGSGIHSVPRNRWKDADFSQMSWRRRSQTLSNASPGIVAAAWQGSALPDWGGCSIVGILPRPSAAWKPGSSHPGAASAGRCGCDHH